MKKLIAEHQIREVVRLLDECRGSIVIVTHVSPDGDAIGSSVGLYHFLVGRGFQVRVIVPNSFPQFLKWLDGVENVLQGDIYSQDASRLIANAELIFCLDFNVLPRIKELGDMVARSSAKKVLIDHHPYPDDFPVVSLSYPVASSTCELIFRLIRQMGGFDELSLPAAEAIYTGMMTDTGGFTYNSNNPDIYLIISELLSKGVDKDRIYRNIYNNYSEERFRMMGFMLSERMKVYPEQRSALLTLSNEEQSRFNRKKGDTEGFVNIPLSIKDVIFSAMFREDTDMIKLSFRSVGKFPANTFASQYFSGGGHLNAAGGEFYGSLAEAVQKFESALPAYFEEHRHKIEE